MPDRTTRLLLVCHGEGLYDRFANLSRHLVTDEGGLSAAGWEQANILAAWLHDHESVDFLVSGGQLRSRLTAQRIGQILRIPITIIPSLPNHLPPTPGEPLPGTAHMLPHPPRPARPSETEAKPIPSPAPVPPVSPPLPPPIPTEGKPGSDLAQEEWAQKQANFFQKTLAVLNEIMAGHWGETVVLVTHSQAIAALISTFFGARNLAIRLDSTGISELRYAQGRWQLVYVNRREHIPCPHVGPVVATQTSRPEQGEEHEHLEKVRRLFNRVASTYAQNKQENDLQRIQDLVRFANLPEDLEILDVGTGPGTLALALANSGAKLVLGVDISEAMLEQAEYLRLSTARADQAARMGFRLAPAHALPFSDDRFDVVFCRLVLQYLTNPAKSIQEMVRVLKPGGTLILAELLSVDDPVKRATQNAIEERRNEGHVSARSVDQYRKLVTAAGLTVERVDTKTFDRELNEWLSSLVTAEADRASVREMLEAGVETDAAGLNARHLGGTLVFDQRMIYLKATKA